MSKRSHARLCIENPRARPLSTATLQMTPPQTPMIDISFDEMDTEPDGARFTDYLRAFYPYHPESTICSDDPDASSVTVPIDTGDIILVHSVQPNGWADGTLLASGARGWLPTNYCEFYEPDYLLQLLDAVTYTWEFAHTHEDNDRKAFASQDYVRRIIAGVRLLLQRSDCMSREGVLIRNVVALRRARRSMLAELSSFSKAASTLQDACESDLSTERFYDSVENIITRAFKVALKGVKFLDCWQYHNDQLKKDHDTPPLTPRLVETRDSSALASEPAAHRQDISEESSSAAGGNSESTSAAGRQTRFDTLDIPTPQSNRPSSLLHKRASASHRMSYRLSYGPNSPTARNCNLASVALTSAHDSFLSSLGVFTGLHLQSRASMELLSETKQAVVACSALIDVAESVVGRDPRNSRLLQNAQEHLKSSLAALIQTIGAQPDEDGDFILSDCSNKPLQAAAACVLSAGSCVVEANAVIERVGDFELPQSGSANRGLGVPIVAAPDDSSLIDKRPSPLPLEQGYEFVQKPLPSSPPPPAPPSPAEKHRNSLLATESAPTSRPSTSGMGAQQSVARVPSLSSTQSRTADLSSDHERQEPPSLELEIPPSSPFTCFPDNMEMSHCEMSPTGQTDSRGVSFHGTNSTDLSSLRSSPSIASTVATSPDCSPVTERPDHHALKESFGSLTESRSTLGGEMDDEESQLLATTYAHELILNQQGCIIGGSLPALVERLTIHDVTPDAVFVNTFYLTFREFCLPRELAQCLFDRFEYVGSNPGIAKLVRLRIYNVVKGWLELHWRNDIDYEALPVIQQLAHGPLNAHLPTASKRLLDLVDRAAYVSSDGRAPRVASLQGKTNTVIGSTVDAEAPVPSSVISKSQLGLLKKVELQSASCSILDFDALELARQITLIQSKAFCRISAEELLRADWTMAESSAFSIKAMARLSNSIGNLVNESVLAVADVKKRALILKQWVKIAKRCRELGNYDAVVAIISALGSSWLARLDQAWALNSVKTRARLQEMREMIDFRMTKLRKVLESHGAPCIPFLGLTLTDLTMNSSANPKLRKLGRQAGLDDQGCCRSVINYDRYAKMARSVGDLQRFQVPYRLAPVPEMQKWIESQIDRISLDPTATPQVFYEKSKLLEPRQSQPAKGSSEISSAHSSYGSASTSFGEGLPERNSIKAKQSKRDFFSSFAFSQALHSRERIVS